MADAKTTIKFLIEVSTVDHGVLRSEEFTILKEHFNEVTQNIINGEADRLDFYDQQGDFIIIPEGVFKNSIIKLVHL